MDLSKYPSADELNSSNNTNIQILDDIFSKIKQAHEADETKVYFTFEGGKRFPNADYIYSILNEKKFNIYWNSPCLWYEISW